MGFIAHEIEPALARLARMPDLVEVGVQTHAPAEDDRVELSWLTCFRMNTAHSTCEKVIFTPIFFQASCTTVPTARLISLPWFVIRLKARGLPSFIRIPSFF